MFQNENLKDYIEQSSTVNLQSIVLAEWNMNFSENITTLGNYRYRPTRAIPTEENFGNIKSTWAPEDEGSEIKYYLGATNSDIVINTGIDLDTSESLINSTPDKTEQMLYSLTDTVGRFRPRSGINKIRFFGKNYLNFANSNMHLQPRFYLASKDDKFKYWTSYRTVTASGGEIIKGIATKKTIGSDYYIDDAAPFVVYNEPVPANRIVVKMQTGVGDVNNGPYKKSNNRTFSDPFYEDPLNDTTLQKQKTPERWRIQYLNTSGTWTTAKSFSLNETRTDSGKRIIGSDGYVELAYGITNAPETFRLLGEYFSEYSLPLNGAIGDAYLVPDANNSNNPGTVYVWDGYDWTADSFSPTYGWYLNEEDLDIKSPTLKNLTSPNFFGSASTIYTPTYREFQFIKGIRIVVETMSKSGSSFDLIEMSPRLVVDLSDKTKSFSIEKIASDIGNTGIPVGQLLASTGSLELFDYDQSFNEYNSLVASSGKITGSIIHNISSKNLQIKMYERITDDRLYPQLKDFFIPIKTMYVDGFPEISTTDRTTTIKLRDLLFHFESIIAPSIMLRNCSVSFAIATLLDSIGFSNYKFYRNLGESEDIVPYFYIAPDTTVAEVLNDLAQSTQTAMFFDEYNNFVTMSRNYIMPTEAERETSITLYGTKDYVRDGIVKNAHSHEITAISFNGTHVTYTCKNSLVPNQSVSIIGATSLAYNLTNVKVFSATATEFKVASNATGQTSKARVLITPALSNIVSLDAENNEIYNGGKVTYTNKYIQKSYATIQEASLLNKGQSYKYKPVLLWEVAGTETLRPVNGEVGNQSSYSLSALVLNSELSVEPPEVVGGIIKKNTVDFGQSIYWLTRFKGYFYANNEIIKYDAVQHFVSSIGNVWIEDITDYQKYFAKLPFNGKIFPTGLVRIYAEPKFNTDGTIKNGDVAKHGRGQFGTKITKHTVLDSTNDWLDPANRKTFKMQSEWLFKNNQQYGETLYKISGVNGTSGAKTFTVSDSTGLKAGLLFYTYRTKVINTQTPTVGGGVVTITVNGHGFVPGNEIKIEGVTPAKYNGITTITATTTNTITFLNKNAASGDIQVAGTVAPLFDNRSLSPAIPAKTKIMKVVGNTITISKALTQNLSNATVYATSKMVEPLGQIEYSPQDRIGFLGEKPTVSGVMKDFFNSSSYTESSDTETIDKSKPNGVIKSSALSIKGPADFDSVSDSSTVLSYVFKNYNSECPTAYSFGTRMRIVGKVLPTSEQKNAAKQIPIGAEILNTFKNSSGEYQISGTGGGIAINIDPSVNNNIGYYFEITALSSNSIIDDVDDNNIESIKNVFFYKILKGANTKAAVPVVLWSGSLPILVDNGMFVGMSKSVDVTNPTVYDLMVETEELSSTKDGNARRKFYLYINGRLLATVRDENAIPLSSNNKNIALFTRGKGLCMFENVFAVGENSKKSNTPLNKKLVFADEKIDGESHRKYLMNPSILETYLKELGPNHQPKYRLYYEEFGTIMRECAYFNVRYDKAYPALYSKISPTFNDSQGYIISNFRSNPYSAEFMIFNATDFALNLDESTGNYLRIQGVTFTQQSAHDLTVEDYFQKNSDLNNYENYTELNDRFIEIQNSRSTYGKKDFTISGTYIQNIDTANNLMKWMVDKNMHPKKSLGVTIFANPAIQLGDIVKIDYNIDNVLQNTTARFVVYHIEYSRSGEGPEMKLYLSEVV